MSTIAEFIAAKKITMTVRPTDANPNMDGGRDMDHWKVTLRCSGRRMILTYSTGSGLRGQPIEASSVLDCLASDAAGVQNARDFSDWCAEYGYDTDSRKAERTYKACQRQAASLQRLLGSTAAYETLLFNTDRE
jgi:hypothetical protein